MPALAAVCVFVTLAIYTAWVRQRTEIRLAQDRSRQLVEVAANTIDGTIAETQTLLFTLSRLLDPAAPPTRNDELLQSIVRASPSRYLNLWITDTLGINHGTAYMPSAGRAAVNNGDRAYFRRALATRRIAVGMAVTARGVARTTWIVPFALPVVDSATRRIRAMVGASIEVDSLDAVRAARDLPDGSVLTIMDTSGTIVLRSRDPQHWVGRRFERTRDEHDNFVKGEGVDDRTSADGVRRLTGFKRTAHAPWMVYVGVPAKYTLDAARTRFLRDLATMVLAMLGVSVIGYRLLRGVSAPIESLTEDARAIAGGELSRRSAIDRDDEVGALATAFNQMADTIVERNQALKTSQEQLLHAQKMDALGSFAGGIAHDFNNYLHSIIGHSELAALSLPDSAPAREDLREIVNSAQRAADLTRQILVFSRKQVVEPRELDLNEVVRGIERMLLRLIGEQRRLELRLATVPVRVRADQGQLEQVIVNLAANARDATPDGGIVTIATSIVVLNDDQRGSTQSGARVVAQLSVSDNGVGIPAEVRDRIFDPFFSTKSRSRGTGLGLAIAYGIVDQSGGTIGVDSAPGRGTMFTIRLPLTLAPEGAMQAMPAPTRAVELRGSGRILLVDDDRGVRTTTERLLRQAGYEVLAAEDGPAALLLLKQQRKPVDLMLTDVIMPLMSGAELARRVRALHPDVPVLFMTGYADDPSVLSDVASQTAECVSKPFTAVQLHEQIQHVLAGRPGVGSR